jgi:hypothetical protein
VFLHSLYGLHVASNLQIPLAPVEIADSPVTPDVSVTFQDCPAWAASALRASQELIHASPELFQDQPDIQFWKLDAGKYFRLVFANGTEFCFDRQGQNIFASHNGKFDLEDVSIPLRGVVMGVILQLRGTPCLHASAIEMRGRAVALCGPSTSGKSTTATAFAKRGYAILTEDVLPLLFREGAFLAQPSFPVLTLWPAAAQLLFGGSHSLKMLCADYAKFYLPLDEPGWSFVLEPQPLGAIYILDENVASPHPFVSELTPQERLVRLAANLYHVRLLPQDVYARELLLLGRIANEVPVRKLNLGSSSPPLDELCDCILADAEIVLSRQSHDPKKASPAGSGSPASQNRRGSI